MVHLVSNFHIYQSVVLLVNDALFGVSNSKLTYVYSILVYIDREKERSMDFCQWREKKSEK